MRTLEHENEDEAIHGENEIDGDGYLGRSTDIYGKASWYTDDVTLISTQFSSDPRSFSLLL